MNTILSAGVVCRRVGLNRVDDLLALEEGCFTTDRMSRRNLTRLLQSPSAATFGAYLRGRLVGSLIVLFRKNSSTARIYSLAVAADMRGRGVGRSLMRRAEREARLRGCRKFRLEVRMDNMDAIRLYEQFGFTDTEVLPGYYEDGAHAFVMRKVLES